MFEEILERIRLEDIDKIKELLDDKEFRTLNSDKYGELLEYACQVSSFDVVDLLLEENLPENRSLLYAVERGDKLILSLILTTGNYNSELGKEALQIALNKEYDELYYMLYRYGLIDN